MTGCTLSDSRSKTKMNRSDWRAQAVALTTAAAAAAAALEEAQKTKSEQEIKWREKCLTRNGFNVEKTIERTFRFYLRKCNIIE